MNDQTPPAGMFDVRVERAADAAEGIKTFDFVSTDGNPLPAFTPGSHVTVRAPNGLLRKYSLCSDPNDLSKYSIAVKLEASGQGGSRSMVEELKEGHSISISQPENAFELVPDAGAYLFIAGGIGITPILSMIKSFGELPPAPWKLYYLGQRPETTAFLEMLQGAEYRNLVVAHHDYGDASQMYDLWTVLEKPTNAHIYCCGPKGLMEGVRDMSGHWPTGRVHFESFNAGGGVKADDKPFEVILERSGKIFEVPVGKSILNVVREAGVKVASSCESGTCGSCRTKLLSGEVDHRDMVLMPEEMESQIMICVSRAKGSSITIDL